MIVQALLSEGRASEQGHLQYTQKPRKSPSKSHTLPLNPVTPLPMRNPGKYAETNTLAKPGKSQRRSLNQNSVFKATAETQTEKKPPHSVRHKTSPPQGGANFLLLPSPPPSPRPARLKTTPETCQNTPAPRPHQPPPRNATSKPAITPSSEDAAHR